MISLPNSVAPRTELPLHTAGLDCEFADAEDANYERKPLKSGGEGIQPWRVIVASNVDDWLPVFEEDDDH